MYITLLKSKIHHAEITDANVNYEGSLTIDSELMAKVGILPYEKILVANLAKLRSIHRDIQSVQIPSN